MRRKRHACADAFGDRLIGNRAFDDFISQHRWAVMTTLRRSGQPSSSVVAYAREADLIVVSTRAVTLKARTLERDPRITLCVINNAEPFNFVEIEGRAEVLRSGILEATRAVFRNIATAGLQEPADLQQWIVDQGRVIVRVVPERVTGVIRPRS